MRNARKNPNNGKPKKKKDVANKLFFSGNGSGELTLEQFSMFVRLLQREALVMQFNQCDQRGEGLLTATDFAKFLVTKVRSYMHASVCVCACERVSCSS